jgi:uracil phosphoribosyltransferase
VDATPTVCRFNPTNAIFTSMKGEFAPRLTVVDHPLVEDCLRRLRDVTTTTEGFRQAARLLTQLLMFEATRDLPLTDTSVITPLEATSARRLATDIVLVPVLRSGLAMLDTAATMFPAARVGFVGLERDESTAVAHGYYQKIPDNLGGSTVMILEPMLATGGSACATLDMLVNFGGTSLRLVSTVAAPEGIAAIASRHPECAVYAAALDRGLNDRKYILPGIGDFGDRFFGTT